MIPKGSRSPAISDARAAAREALQEAGVKGRVRREPIGSYIHDSDRRGAVKVVVYELAVEEQLDSWREQSTRKRKWASPAEAARMTTQIGLRQFLRQLPP